MTDRNTTHLPKFHRRSPIKEPVRVASPASVTIATALNAGDSIDGITLAAGDRVLLPNQSTASQNGVYIAGTTPVRAYDMDVADEVPGVLVAVLAGTTYAGSLFQNRNTGAVTLGTTSLTFAVVGELPGNFVTTTDGGGETIKSHGSMGSTETIDLADGNYHYGTLNADCTFTFTAVLSGALRSFTLELTEDGTGGWDPTWPVAVVWQGGVAPTHDTTLGSTSFYTFFTRDGGTTWYGFPVGGSSGGAVTAYRPLMATDGTNWYVVVDGDGTAVMVEMEDA